MRYVIDKYYDDTRQECTNCGWKGSRYDEPFPVCPLCFHRVKTTGSRRGNMRREEYICAECGHVEHVRLAACPECGDPDAVYATQAELDMAEAELRTRGHL